MWKYFVRFYRIIYILFLFCYFKSIKNIDQILLHFRLLSGKLVELSERQKVNSNEVSNCKATVDSPSPTWFLWTSVLRLWSVDQKHRCHMETYRNVDSQVLPPDSLIQSLHFNKISRYFVCTFKFEKYSIIYHMARWFYTIK